MKFGVYSTLLMLCTFFCGMSYATHQSQHGGGRGFHLTDQCHNSVFGITLINNGYAGQVSQENLHIRRYKENHSEMLEVIERLPPGKNSHKDSAIYFTESEVLHIWSATNLCNETISNSLYEKVDENLYRLISVSPVLE